MKGTRCNINYDHKYLIKDGTKGFKSVDPHTAECFAIVKGQSITFGWKFEEDGPVVTELYILTADGNVTKSCTQQLDNICFAFRNKKTDVTMYVHEVRISDNGTIVTNETIGPWLTNEGAVEWRNGIEIYDGTYPTYCGSILVRDDCELYRDGHHAAWYSEPTIDGKSETCRAKLLDLGTDIGGDGCLDIIRRNLSAIKAYAESNNIKLWYDTDENTIRAVKVPKGYKCTMSCDHEHEDQIPWELMPVVGRIDSSTYYGADYQMGLVKIPEVKERDD